MLPAVVITGASTGIGREFARIAAGEGRAVVLAARSETALQALAGELGAARGKVRALPLDLAGAGATDRLLAFLDAEGLYCDMLVANAGIGLLGTAAELPRDAQLGLVDLNARALTDQVLRVLPGMVARRTGGIITVASIASFMPGPYMALYYASKAYVRSFSEALHEELTGSGVTVTCLCPGPVATPFFERMDGDRSLFMRLLPKTDAKSVARAGWRAFKAGRRVVVPGLGARLGAWVTQRMPHRFLLPGVAFLQRAELPKAAE